LAVSLARRAVRTLNAEGFLKALPLELRAVQVGNEVIAKFTTDNVFEMPIGKLMPLTPAEWADPSIGRVATNAVLIFAVAAVCSGHPSALAKLRTCLSQVEGLNPHLQGLFERIDDPGTENASLSMSVASTLGRMLVPDYALDATAAFAATVHFYQLLRRHELGEVAAVTVVTSFSRIWQDILANRRFSVCAPTKSEPAILESLSKRGPYLARLAHLILASQTAVTTRLSDELRAALQAAAVSAPRSA
jgi:hypothetical protein